MTLSKAYTSASNAKRAGKGDPDWTGEVHKTETGFHYVIKNEELDAVIEAEANDADQSLLDSALDGSLMDEINDEDEAAPVDVAVAPKGKKFPHIGASWIEGPVAFVHEMADTMLQANPDVTRKEILAELRAHGVATHTAATQYQKWKKNRGV